ncbi:hypothetical protein Sjap_020694 [Stephania japonica]|uniref:Uncharacterized protein n=1 Tax=Stephania japonica TaxID=461633 RepID=A0AAP0I0M5_9MAGN
MGKQFFKFENAWLRENDLESMVKEIIGTRCGPERTSENQALCVETWMFREFESASRSVVRPDSHSYPLTCNTMKEDIASSFHRGKSSIRDIYRKDNSQKKMPRDIKHPRGDDKHGKDKPSMLQKKPRVVWTPLLHDQFMERYRLFIKRSRDASCSTDPRSPMYLAGRWLQNFDNQTVINNNTNINTTDIQQQIWMNNNNNQQIQYGLEQQQQQPRQVGANTGTTPMVISSRGTDLLQAVNNYNMQQSRGRPPYSSTFGSSYNNGSASAN